MSLPIDPELRFEQELADAVEDWIIKPEEEEVFTAGFEAGYLAGIDRGMEVEHDATMTLQLEHGPTY